MTETSNPTYEDFSDSDGGDPNVIFVDVTSDDSTNRVFVDESPSVSTSISAVPSVSFSPSRPCVDLIIDFETSGDGTLLGAGDYVADNWRVTLVSL